MDEDLGSAGDPAAPHVLEVRQACNVSDSIGTSETLAPIRKGEEFTVKLLKEDRWDVLGAKVLQSMKTCHISVSSVSRGLIQDWNEAHPARRVKVGDKLVSVNGVRGPTASVLMKKLKRESHLELVFVSCS